MDSSSDLSRSKILCHRGFWTSGEIPNSITSFRLAAQAGFGIELDIRDHDRELVVSHDFPENESPTLERVLEELSDLGFDGYLALNVKSDGLVELITDLEVLASMRHFFFDMTVPESRRYQSAGLAVASRLSELEGVEKTWGRSPFHESGVCWLDSFYGDWWLKHDWDDLFQSDATVFVVSPELHGRDPKNAWGKVRRWVNEGRDVGICTDYPVEFQAGKDIE